MSFFKVNRANSKKILAVIGTRPEAIKMAPLILELRRQGYNALVYLTGQHDDEMTSALRLFDILPDFDDGFVAGGRSLNALCADLHRNVPEVLRACNPQRVLVHGDTVSAATTALASFYQGVPVDHVEAGLRSGNLSEPWPEEGNRRLISSICGLHFAPSQLAMDSLLKEGHSPANVFLTGNTVIDALNYIKGKKINLPPDIRKKIASSGFDQNIILVTAHRRENFGAALRNICDAIKRLSTLYPKRLFVFSVHKNPSVSKLVHKKLEGIDNVLLSPPLGYLDFVSLLSNSAMALTDSGGIQEEALALKIPVVVLRNTTERPEVLISGLGVLVGSDQNKICNAASSILERDHLRTDLNCFGNPYGAGDAAKKIVEVYNKGIFI